jgi:DNA-binding transcriptional regulator YiaG
MMKIARTLNQAIWKQLDAAKREKFVEYLHKDLYSYFLQLGLRCVRKDRDAWKASSDLIGDRIRAARKKLGLNQHQMAKSLHVTEGTLVAWEANHRHPSKGKLRQLKQFFGPDLLSPFTAY